MLRTGHSQLSNLHTAASRYRCFSLDWLGKEACMTDAQTVCGGTISNIRGTPRPIVILHTARYRYRYSCWFFFSASFFFVGMLCSSGVCIKYLLVGLG